MSSGGFHTLIKKQTAKIKLAHLRLVSTVHFAKNPRSSKLNFKIDRWHRLLSMVCNRHSNSATNSNSSTKQKTEKEINTLSLVLCMRNFKKRSLGDEEEAGGSPMPISILEACKKRKRKPKLYGFHTFGDPGCPINVTGPFRDNIRIFLRECADLEEYSLEKMSIWCTLLVKENTGFVLPLYTIEEKVDHSLRPFCDHCRCAGRKKEPQSVRPLRFYSFSFNRFIRIGFC